MCAPWSGASGTEASRWVYTKPGIIVAGETNMRSFLAALTLATLFAAASSQPSRAEVTYPWCAQYAPGGVFNCGFTTIEQCRATLSGNGGSCDQNPLFRARAEPVPG